MNMTYMNNPMALNKIEILDKIGEGAYGKVFKAKLIDSNQF